MKEIWIRYSHWIGHKRHDTPIEKRQAQLDTPKLATQLQHVLDLSLATLFGHDLALTWFADTPGVHPGYYDCGDETEAAKKDAGEEGCTQAESVFFFIIINMKYVFVYLIYNREENNLLFIFSFHFILFLIVLIL